MPGITGWASTPNKSQTSFSLKTMLDTLSYPWYKASNYTNTEKTVQFGCTDSNISDASCLYTSEDNKTTVCLYGSIYSPEKSKTSLLPFLAKLYQEKGSKFANDIQGEFFLVIVDHAKKQILLSSDRYGRRPVYFTVHDNRFIFGSSLKPILVSGAVPVKIDPTAIADFLTFAFIPGEKTLLHGVELLPPASTVCFNLTTAEHHVERYWDLREHLNPSTQSESTILKQMAETFQTAVDRRLAPDADNWLSLSAGMDSRVVASAMGHSNQTVKAVTSGIDGCYERKVTSKIAKTLGMEHFFYTFDEDQIIQSSTELNSLISEAINLTDGMRGTASSAMTAFSSRLRRQHHLGRVVTGHGGEIAKLDEAYNFSITSNNDVKDIESNATDWAFKRLILPNGPKFNHASLYGGELSRVFTEAPREHISHILSSLDNDLPAEQTTSFLFLNELFRKRASLALSVQRAYVDVHVPFYDDDFLAVAVNAPLSIRSKYKVHKHIIQQNNPSLLNIVLSETRMRPFPAKWEKFFRGIPYSAVKRLGLYKQDVPEHYFSANTNTAYFNNILMDERTLDRGYFEHDNMQKLLQTQAKGVGTANTLVHLLTIVELWHRDFIDTLPG